ncbi:hypothetical protein SAMN05216474_1465 [Lishizhenia tianjinensis]|uniref:Uncharacterized protein n=1 Tax=Lishizhenia tianjinensis TaxID=477690 RepID=A0A1I6ZLP5_9FLAO|nr:hypothetical protein [Lishizhenia tianjinensis]SFT63609.1 hypothetical protein SAMN05216474_1465 [Lishizhenia tianjinensis]
MENEILDDHHTDGIAVNYDLRKVLFKLINNSKFLGITYLFVASIYAILLLKQFVNSDFLGIFIGVMLAILLFLLYYVLFHFLNTAANKMKVALENEEQKDLDTALNNLRLYYKMKGIIIISILSLLVVVFAIFLFNN